MVAILALVGSQAAHGQDSGQFAAVFTLSGNADDPANVFPLTPLTIGVSDAQTYGTNYWDSAIARLQLNWSNSSAGLSLSAGATWAWGSAVTGLIAPPPHITLNDTDLSDGIVNIENTADITIAPASPFVVGVLALNAPAYNPGGGNTHTLDLSGGSYDDGTLTAVIDVLPNDPEDPSGVLLAPPNGTGLTLSTYTFTVVPGGKWTGGSGTAWQTPGNWSSAMTPDPTFTAVFDGPPAANYPVLTGSGSAKGIVFKTAGWIIDTDGSHTLDVGTGGISSAGNGANAVNPTVNFTGPAAVNVGSGNTLVLAAVTAGNNPLTKSGAGALVLAGANVYSGGTTVSEGTLLVTNTSDSGTGSGPVTVGAATLGGTGFIKGPVTLTGDSTLTSTGTLTIYNTLTVQGSANQLSSGTVVTTDDVTIDPGAVFIINGTLGGGTGNLIVRGTLMGKGTINKDCILDGGVLSPGDPSTIKIMAQVRAGAAPKNFSFEIGAAEPNYARPSNSVNDLVRLTNDAAPFADATGGAPAALTAADVIDVYFLSNDPALGDYKAEFFAATDFTDAVAGATYQYWRLDPRGSRYHNGNFYSLLDASLVDWSVVPETATFGGAPASGYITEFTVIPEPATLSLLALGGLGVLLRRRWK